MPFMQGRAAMSRTLQYLQQGQIILNKNVRIMIFAYNADHGSCKKFPHHQGLYNFVFWHLPQLKYKNPDTQMVTLKMMTPSPWIQAYYDDDTKILIDCDSRTREEIHDHINKILGQSESMLKRQVRETSMMESNPANFGSAFPHNCICEIPGQMPCPGWQPLPPELTGKGRKKLREMEAESGQ